MDASETDTDSELGNNFLAFRTKGEADSDCESDGEKFVLRINKEKSYLDVSDSDNEDGFNRRGGKIDDIDIADISEHSSDDIDSDSDELVSPDQKQIKKEKKRKKRKMEAIKKAK